MVSIIRLQAIRASGLYAMVVPQTHVHVFVFSCWLHLCSRQSPIYMHNAHAAVTHTPTHMHAANTSCAENSQLGCA